MVDLTKKLPMSSIMLKVKLINVRTFNRWFKRKLAVSLGEFIKYIDDARHVITSMFQDVMLFVALEKKFRYISADPNRDVKISTTIDRLLLSSVMLRREDICERTDIFLKQINQVGTKLLFDKMRANSSKEFEKMLEMLGNIL